MPSVGYISVATDSFHAVGTTMVKSARRVGFDKNIHILTNRTEIKDCHCDVIRNRMDYEGYWFKLNYIKSIYERFNYDYYCWIDADSYFVRNPVGLEERLCFDKCYIPFLWDLTEYQLQKETSWYLPIEDTIKFLQNEKVDTSTVYSINAGLMMLRRDYVLEFINRCFELKKIINQRNVCDEYVACLIANTVQKDKQKYRVSEIYDLWACDLLRSHSKNLPDGTAWLTPTLFQINPIYVNPAIVHLIRDCNSMMRAK